MICCNYEVNNLLFYSFGKALDERAKFSDILIKPGEIDERIR